MGACVVRAKYESRITADFPGTRIGADLS